MKDQELVRVLWALYRYGAAAGALLGAAGLALAVVTGAWRRHLGLVLFTATLAAGVAGRILVIALMDATVYPAAGNGTYVIPGTDFYAAFGVVGTWLLATVVRERRRASQGATSSSPDESPAPGDHDERAPEPEPPTPPRTVLVP